MMHICYGIAGQPHTNQRHFCGCEHPMTRPWAQTPPVQFCFCVWQAPNFVQSYHIFCRLAVYFWRIWKRKCQRMKIDSTKVEKSKILAKLPNLDVCHILDLSSVMLGDAWHGPYFSTSDTPVMCDWQIIHNITVFENLKYQWIGLPWLGNLHYYK